MATEKQIEANRANAQKSTGPRTAEGKAASSRNNYRHGLATRGFVILAGQQEAFEQLEQDLRAQLAPAGGLQEVLFKRILECSWNLERCRQATITLHANSAPELDPLLDQTNAALYANIQRYTKENESSLFKAIRELGKLQPEVQFRQAQPQPQDEDEGKPLSEACSTIEVTKTVTRTSQLEAKTKALNLATELKAKAHLPKEEFARRYEANYAA